MLAGLYIGYIIVLAKWKPRLMPPLPESERRVELPRWAQTLAPRGRNALAGLWRAAIGGNAGVAKRTVLAQLFVTLVPALFIAALLGVTYRMATAPEVEASTAGLIQAGGLVAAPEQEREGSSGLIGGAEPEEKEAGAKEFPVEGAKDAAPAGEKAVTASPGAAKSVEKKSAEPAGEADAEHREGIVVSYRQDERHGLLALCRVRCFLRGVRVAWRAGGHRAVGPVARHDARAIHDPCADHHLPARLAARVDGDHHHL